MTRDHRRLLARTAIGQGNADFVKVAPFPMLGL